MKNDFTDVMATRSDEELIKIVTLERGNYEPDAILAADFEMASRKLDITSVTEVTEKVIEEDMKIVETSRNAVSTGIRFTNFIIDFFVWSYLAYIFKGLIIVNSADSSGRGYNQSSFIENLFINSVFLVLYYTTMEIAFQRTLGKFATKTKVVTESGEKPSTEVILKRTFCRLIPFDGLTFLMSNGGMHDTLSKTRVVKIK
jgi:uncharacterized RDD family membrane protein YckC